MAREKEETWYPCRIEPLASLAFDTCEVLPGIVLSKIKDERGLLDKAHGMTTQFNPNLYDAIIKFDPDKYEPALVERLRVGGSDVEKYLAGIPPEVRDHAFLSEDAVRHVLTALLLMKRLAILTPGWRVRIQKTEADGGGRLAGVGEYWSFGKSDGFGWAKYDRIQGPVTCEQLQKVVAELEPYYRPAFWHSDSMGIALGSFWSAVFASFIDHSYLSLSMVLEALLSTSQNEVTHQICERAAVLLTQDVEERMKIYEEIYDLYSLRSTIVHGSLVIEKRKAADGSFMDAKYTRISPQMHARLVEISVELIWTVLNAPDLMGAITSGRGLKKAYLRRIFG
jgi:hypothetical protein